MSAPSNIEMMDALLGLREAMEFGFANVERSVDRRFDEMDERWNRRFMALENRVEHGFREVDARFNEVNSQLVEIRGLYRG